MYKPAISRINKRIRAIRVLRRKEEKTNRNKYKENAPISEIKSLEAPYDIVTFPKGAFINAITAKEEKHRNANFAKNAKISDRRYIENGKKAIEPATWNSNREKPKMMEKHPDDCDSLHDFGIVGRQKIIYFF